MQSVGSCFQTSTTSFTKKYIRMDNLRIEHFKALKEEHRQYLFHVQQLWLFKLSTLGAVIATAIFNNKIIEVSGLEKQTIIAWGLISMPLLAFIIDLKVLEVGLHVKLISQHLKEKFSDSPEIHDWETKLWSGTQFSVARTRLTIIAALGISLLVLLVSLIIIYGLKPNWLPFLISAGVILPAIGVYISLRIIPKLIK
jgi:hypothetical protein